jgi:hypothetical protein
MLVFVNGGSPPSLARPTQGVAAIIAHYLISMIVQSDDRSPVSVAL